MLSVTGTCSISVLPHSTYPKWFICVYPERQIRGSVSLQKTLERASARTEAARSVRLVRTQAGVYMHTQTNMHTGQGTRREGRNDPTPLCWESTVTYQLSLPLTASPGAISASVIPRYKMNLIWTVPVRVQPAPLPPRRQATRGASHVCVRKLALERPNPFIYLCASERAHTQTHTERVKKKWVCHWFASKQRTHSALFYLPKLKFMRGNESLNTSWNASIIQKVNI